MIGAYLTGDSMVHRAGAGLKLILLSATVVIVVLLPEWWMLLVAVLVTASGFAIARVPVRTVLAQLRPVLWLLLFAAPLNALFAGWETAVMMVLRVTVCVALAALVTVTTRVSAMLDAIRAALRPLGSRVDAERVGVLLAMTIRAVPLMTEIVAAVLESRRARGVERSLRAIAVPVVVRSLQTADALGEALIARGFDD